MRATQLGIGIDVGESEILYPSARTTTIKILRVGPVRSPAELEDLWAIDNAAYGEASITYERFQDWWLSFPLGLRALFFKNRVMGAIGIWP